MECDKRAVIMKAAEALFKSRRFHEITTDDIAAKAQVGKGTLYRYFKDKDDLFLQTAAHGVEQLCELVASVGGSAQPFDQMILAACTRISDFFESRRQMFRMMNSEEIRPQVKAGKDAWHERRRRVVDALATVVQRGIDEGLLRADTSAAVLSGFLLGMLRARFRDMAEDPHVTPGCQLVVDLFLRGAQRQ